MKKIALVVVLGAGVMGREIALNAADHGFQVRVADAFPDACRKAEEWANAYLDKSVEKGKMTEEQKAETLSRLTYCQDPALAVQGSDLVIEAIIEDETLKRQLFAMVNQNAPKDALIATNSSYIPSSRFAALIDHPGRLCNLHYFNPAMRMKLVEIVRGAHTSQETVEALTSFVQALGKESIVVNKEIEGFVVNRLLRAVQNEAFYLVQNGIATVEDVDRGAEKGLNYPMGPFRLMDLAGIDICYRNRQATYEKTGNPADKPPEFLKEKFDRGEFGRKTGKGWYSYT